MEKSFRVFVCSTYRDLVSERNALIDGLEWLRTQFPAATYFCPRSIQPLDLCKEEIRGSDVLVLILGHVHGVMAPGLDIPHGEAEYNEGVALGKQILVYFRDEKTGLVPAHFERDVQRAGQLKAFKDKLSAQHGAKVFTDPQSLVHLVNLDLARLAQEAGLDAKPGSKATRQKMGMETRRIPIIGVLAAVEPPPSEPEDTGVTRTIPILQKALATPFRRRTRSSSRTGKALVTVAVVLVAVGFVLARFHKLPASHLSAQARAAAKAADNRLPQGMPAAEADSAEDEVQDEAPPPAPKPDRGAVVMMEDPDTVKTFLRKAQDGSPAEKFRVGQMFETGEGHIRRNDSAAFHWYRRAAEAGHAEAQYKIATMYRWGKGTPKSTFQAARWYQASAEQGNSKAEVRLGQMYRTGKGVPKNETLAFKWFLKAADQKDPEAEKIIAQLKEE